MAGAAADSTAFANTKAQFGRVADVQGRSLPFRH